MVEVGGWEGLIGKLLPTSYMEVLCCPHLVVSFDYHTRESSRGEIELAVEGVW